MNKFNQHSNELTFKFESQAAANHFKQRLSGQGEQDYWLWMDEREREEGGPITGLVFDYLTGDSSIPVKCGRANE